MGFAFFLRTCFFQIRSDLLKNFRIICYNVCEIFAVNITESGKVNRFCFVEKAETVAAFAVDSNFFIQ